MNLTIGMWYKILDIQRILQCIPTWTSCSIVTFAAAYKPDMYTGEKKSTVNSFYSCIPSLFLHYTRWIYLHMLLSYNSRHILLLSWTQEQTPWPYQYSINYQPAANQPTQQLKPAQYNPLYGRAYARSILQIRQSIYNL